MSTSSQEIVDKVGVASFFAMSTLILFCIGVGFFAVFEKFNQPNWKEACIENGGVPVQIAKSTFDCKVI
jgi:hypothetical protein